MRIYAKLTLLCVILLAVTLGSASFATGVTISATLTADNHYAIYVGNADGTNLNYIGRNESTFVGNPGDTNWEEPETFTIPIGPGQYIYVVAWDGDKIDHNPQMWIGQFTLPGGSTLYSNTTDWDYYVTNMTGQPDTPDTDPLDTSTPINLTSLRNYIQTANGLWATPTASAPNDGKARWNIKGISPEASFIWHDTLDNKSSSGDMYVIYRSALPVPIPGSVLLLSTGLLGLGLLGWRRNRG